MWKKVQCSDHQIEIFILFVWFWLYILVRNHHSRRYFWNISIFTPVGWKNRPHPFLH
jgi:hypothetical protein